MESAPVRAGTNILTELFSMHSIQKNPIKLLKAQCCIYVEILRNLPFGIQEESKANKDHYQVDVGGFIPGFMHSVIHRTIVTHDSVTPSHGAVRQKRKEHWQTHSLLANSSPQPIRFAWSLVLVV